MTARVSVLLLAPVATLCAALPASAAAAKSYDYIPYCAYDRNSAISVPGGTDQVLKTAWLAKTKTQVHDYQRYVTITVTVDGKTIANPKSYWGPMFYDAVDGGWESQWLYDAGVLAKDHSMNVDMKLKSTRALDDGSTHYPKFSENDECAIAAI